MCENGKIIPHPYECSRFIKCGEYEQQNIILSCKEPTLFNQITLACDFAHNVVCKTYYYVTRPNYISLPNLPSKTGLFF